MSDTKLVKNACTLEEAQFYRRQLRLLGKERFVEETIFSGKISAKKLCTAFGILPPEMLDGSDDEDYYPLLSLGLEREIRKRWLLLESSS